MTHAVPSRAQLHSPGPRGGATRTQAETDSAVLNALIRVLASSCWKTPASSCRWWPVLLAVAQVRESAL